MSQVQRLQARADAYRRQQAIALGLISWCEEHGVKPDSFYQRAEEAAREATRAERQLRKISRHPGSTVQTPH